LDDSMAKMFIIANPVAGNGSGERAIPAIHSCCQELALAYELVTTERPLHAIEIAREASSDGYELIVSAGGDGTANEVLNGIMQAHDQGSVLSTLGMLGVGRGNDFAHMVRVPDDLRSACALLKSGRKRYVDIGRVYGGDFPEGRYFGNSVGVGFDAIGTIEVAKLPRWGGFLSFFFAVLKTIFLYTEAPMAAIELENETLEQRSLMISVMNGQRLGGGFWMAPDSEPDDGSFDVCIAADVSRMRILQLIPHFMRGSQGTQAEITMRRSSRISITSPKAGLPAHADGEIICVDGRRLDIELFPRALPVICG
jgi:diacylglycerol kinase (ATP)